MADTAAWVVERVIPDVPVRQWVLSLPHRIRHLCAFDHHAAREVRSVFIRVISAFYRRQTKQIDARGKTGAIAFTQRFDSALRLNLHFHTLWPDGVFDCASSRDNATFHEAPQPTQADIERLAHTIETRALRRLRRCGRLTDLDGADSSAHDPSPLDTMRAAAILGVSALIGSRQGRRDPRLRQDAPGADFDRGKLCANSNGFSLHGGVRVNACNKKRLEKLIRYAARPPIVPQRLTITENGKALYTFKRPWRDDSTHVVLEPETLLERLTALIPHPFVKLVNYHGVFASAFPLRHTVVPPPPDDARAHPTPHHPHAHHAPPRRQPDDASPLAPTKPKPKPRPRTLWAELLRRVYLVDALTCPHCGATRRLLAFVTDQSAIHRILDHLANTGRGPPDADTSLANTPGS